MIKKATGLFIILFFIVYTSCEKAIVVYPGNNQDLEPLPPDGSISWIIPANDDNIGQLDEHSSNISIGTLNAEDPNPDDEFSYELTNFSQYFQIIENSEGEIALQVKSDINFESDQIPASKQFDLIIQVEDDSFEKLSNNFTIRIKIVDVNETPLWKTLPNTVADIGVPYSATMSWGDTDVGQDTPELSWNDEKPSWLEIEVNEQEMSAELSGIPTGSGVPVFTVTISDGDLEVQEEISITVRANSAPSFNNVTSLPTTIKVGCWDDNDQLLNLSWYDPDNYNLSSDNQDIVTLDVSENLNWMGVNTTTGEVYCISAPTNNDAGNSTILLSLTDDRPISPQSFEYEHSLSVVANDAPGFTNLNSFPDGMNANDTLNFDLEWVDPNEDLTLFNLQVGSYYADQLSWFNIDQSGNVEIIPGSNHNGEYELKFYISDECYSTEEQKTFTIENNY